MELYALAQAGLGYAEMMQEDGIKVKANFNKKDNQPEGNASKEKEKKTEKILNEDELHMAYSKYEWITLDRKLFERIRQKH